MADAPQPGGLLPVRLQEVLLGPTAPTGSVVELPYANPSIPQTSGLSPNRAWRSAVLSVNAPVTVVLSLDGRADVKPGEPMAVVTDEHWASTIRSLAVDVARLEAQTGAIPDAVASLSRRPNEALAGYLMIVLHYTVSFDRPDLASFLSLQMAASESVPDQARALVAGYGAMEYSRLSEPDKAVLARQLTALALSPKSAMAEAGFHGLEQLAASTDSIWAFVSEPELARIASAYRAIMAAGRMPAYAAVESKLGIRRK
jgi:hypothetical protein